MEGGERGERREGGEAAPTINVSSNMRAALRSFADDLPLRLATLGALICAGGGGCAHESAYTFRGRGVMELISADSPA